MTVPLANALPLLAVLAAVAVAGLACHLAERCIRGRCCRPCCVPTHDDTRLRLDSSPGVSSTNLMRSEL